MSVMKTKTKAQEFTRLAWVARGTGTPEDIDSADLYQDRLWYCCTIFGLNEIDTDSCSSVNFFFLNSNFVERKVGEVGACRTHFCLWGKQKIVQSFVSDGYSSWRESDGISAWGMK